MIQFFSILQIIIVFFLVLIIVLQKNSDDGISSMAGSNVGNLGGSKLFSSTSLNKFLTRVTLGLGILFMLNSLLLSKLVSKENNINISTQIEKAIEKEEKPKIPEPKIK